MSALTPTDVRHWDPAAILKVFQVANARARSLQRLGQDLGQVDALLQQWQGEGGDAFRADLGEYRKDIEEDGRQSEQVGAAVSTLWEDVQICKSMMSEIDDDAQANGWTITDDWKVDIGDTWLLMGSEEAELQRQILQSHLDMLNTKAHATDHELATALNAAVGKVQLDSYGREIPQAPPKPDQPRDVGSQDHPGATDVTDPGVTWQPGFKPGEWEKSWQNPLLADNPPGYTGGPGAARDQAWQEYLAHFPQGQRGFLPNPDAVNDPGLKMIGAAANQLGTSYAWGGKGLNGPGRGTLSGDPVDPPGGAHIYHDDQRIGFDCSGLTEYAAAQARPGVDIGQGTSGQLDSPNLTTVAGGAPLKPGDLIYYGPGGADHVAIYIAPGVILNAPESGLPVELDHRTTTPNGNLVRARRLP